MLSLAELRELHDKLRSAKLPARMIHAIWLLLATASRVGELSGAKLNDFNLVGYGHLLLRAPSRHAGHCAICLAGAHVGWLAF